MNARSNFTMSQSKTKLDQIRELALEIASRAGGEIEASDAAEPLGVSERRSPGPYGYARLAAQSYYERGLREQFFDGALFGEPAWDIMLDLFAQMNRGRQVSVTSACIAARVPATTALRWIGLLVDRGILVRVEDPSDRRRAFLELAQPALLKFNQYLQAIDNKRASP
jgi:hypothetical protein